MKKKSEAKTFALPSKTEAMNFKMNNSRGQKSKLLISFWCMPYILFHIKAES